MNTGSDYYFARTGSVGSILKKQSDGQIGRHTKARRATALSRQQRLAQAPPHAHSKCINHGCIVNSSVYYPCRTCYSRVTLFSDNPIPGEPRKAKHTQEQRVNPGILNHQRFREIPAARRSYDSCIPFAAHCYETGGVRRCRLRGRENILKRQLVHVGAFNLSLILRKLLGAGTPRELKSRAGRISSRLFGFLRRTTARFLLSADAFARLVCGWHHLSGAAHLVAARAFFVVLPRAARGICIAMRVYPGPRF
jgi:hypothetical protein